MVIRTVFFSLGLSATLLASAGSASAQTAASRPAASAAPDAMTDGASADTMLTQMLTDDKADASMFAADFLAQIPVAKVNRLLRAISTDLGDFSTLDGSGEKYVAHYAKGSVAITVKLNGGGKIDYLLFGPEKKN